MNEPITRSEMYFAALGGEVVTPPAPITRMDMYLAYLNGMTDTYPEPITRTEQYLYKLCQNGMGGGGVTIRNQNKTITENGRYKADNGYTGLGTVIVNVPQKEPVVQALDVTENGVYNPPAGVDGFAPVTVNVEASGGNGLPYDMGEFVLDADMNSGAVIPHNLGAVPDFVMVWTDDITGTPAATDFADSMGFIYARAWMGINRQYSSSMFGEYPNRVQVMSFTRNKNFTTEAVTIGPTSNSYTPNSESYTDKTITLHGLTAPNGSRWRAGVTYKYFVASAWWNIKEVNV